MQPNMLTKHACLELLPQSPIGRVGITYRALPSIHLVNFTVSEESVIFPAAHGSEFAEATHEAIVAFQADTYDPREQAGWSVMGVGRTSPLMDPDDFTIALLIPHTPWRPGASSQDFVRLDLAIVSGWQVGPLGDGPEANGGTEGPLAGPAPFAI
jgi:uncharacterized protein